MRTFKITIAWILVAFCVGITGAVYLQSQGAAVAVGSLLSLVLVSFLYDHRTSIFSPGEAKAKKKDELTGTAVAQGVALTRLAEGEVRTACQNELRTRFGNPDPVSMTGEA